MKVFKFSMNSNLFYIILFFFTGTIIGFIVNLLIINNFFLKRLKKKDKKFLSLNEEFDLLIFKYQKTKQIIAELRAECKFLNVDNKKLSQQLNMKNSQDSLILNSLIPIKEKLNYMNSQITSLEKDRSIQYNELVQSIQETKVQETELLNITQSLISTLSSNTARGQWGEIQLRKLVEISGMINKIDFVEQVYNYSLDGSTQRPDMIIQLPNKKQIVIDAKVPITSYLKAKNIKNSNHEEIKQRSNFMKKHAKSLRSHIDLLSQKKYWEGVKNSPEFVICFIPLESFLSSALQEDLELLEYSIQKKVILASPISLMAILKTIAYAWQQELLTKDVKNIFQNVNNLYKRIIVLTKCIAKLGNSLKNSTDNFNTLVGSVESRIIPSVKKLNSFDHSELNKLDILNTELRDFNISKKNISKKETIISE